jgi:hypothetical protein
MLDQRRREQLEAALAAKDLRGLVAAWQAAGQSQAAVYDAFLAFMLALRAEGREADEDAVADAMDFISGWCSRAAMWFDRELTEADRAEHRRTNPGGAEPAGPGAAPNPQGP